MKQQLRHIYEELSNGRLSQSEALEKIKALKQQEHTQAGAVLLAAPVWQVATIDPAAPVDSTERHVVLCELPGIDVEPLLPGNHCMTLVADPRQTIAQRYGAHALACFGRLQTILNAKPRGTVLVQVVVPNDDERALLAGLSGLLKTAALENPRIVGQLVLVSPAVTAEELVRCLDAERRSADAIVRYEDGVRQVVRWQEAPADVAPVAFRNDGVYLITGGAGALGLLFAKEILARTADARIVLTGRKASFDGITDSRVTYRQLDLTDRDQVQQLIATLAGLSGILHCAGMIADNFILRKPAAEFTEVLAPKVEGTIHLDEATRDLPLDFFVLFSSVVGAMGNVGQSDYAAANAFMDQFAAWRNRQVTAGRRHGRTRSISWSLWEAGGMGAGEENRELLEQSTGIQPMRTATGLDAFHRSLALAGDQLLVAEGDLARIREALRTGRPVQPVPAALSEAAPIDAQDLLQKTEEYLRRQCAELLKLPFEAIDPQAALEKYGIDSILAMKLTNHLEKSFGSLSKTLFFEYQTIRALSEYFVQSHAGRLAALFPRTELQAVEPRRRPAPVKPARRAAAPVSDKPRRDETGRDKADEPIAIVGLSGRYPEAVDLEAYWSNLRDGKDCIIEVPQERWDWREYYSDDRTKGGHHYSKWGGFIAGVDEFDPLFFNISPKEARLIDPQERLFLQHAWMAVEDAGYTRASLQVPYEDDLAGQVGVYVGVMFTEYQLFGRKDLGVASSGASIANRVSYALNLHGPSVTFDTMCSSSLTAIHFACLDLKLGRTSLAMAGGVNVSIHPNKYLMLSAGQFISSDGHCQSFGEGGDGYIPGEGVGVVVLKRLSDAERDGDHIYGVIRGSSINHGGKTNGYTVPNPQAQASAIRRALAESHTDARHISYVEAHGTGTKLGDPIEIAALNKAFQQHTRDTGFCLIGSAKSNIGHCESAAGIAGLTKVLLQMQHRQIVPSLHSAQLNPHIDFDATPFTVNQSLRPWEQPVVDGRTLPRIAGISSFGAGGSNAHMVIEEYASSVAPAAFNGPVVIVLSARTSEQLRQKAVDLLSFVRERQESVDLLSMAFTLQVGREPMDERLGLVVRSVEQLVEKLQSWIAGEAIVDDVYTGQVKRNREALAVFTADADLQQTVEKWFSGRKLSRLVDLWVKGLDLDWSRLYGEARLQRMSLPVYPFARDRYWVDVAAPHATQALPVAPTAAVLHPLLHSNTSDLTQQSYRSTFSGNESFLTAQRLLPAAAYLEMARAAVEQAAGSCVELRNVVWAQPVSLEGGKQIDLALLAGDREPLGFEIYSDEVHCQGRAITGAQPEPLTVDLNRVASGELLVKLPVKLPLRGDAAFVVDPSVVEHALHAALALTGGSSSFRAIDSVRILAPCSGEMVAWIRPAGDQRLDVDLCDASGTVCVQLQGVTWRAASVEIAEPEVVPVFEPLPVAIERREIEFVRAPQITPAPADRKKRAAISLSAPGAVNAKPISATRPVITLGVPAQGSAAPVATAVHLYDGGNGIFSIEIAASRSAETVAHLLQALERVQQEASAKVLLLSGIEHCFLRGGREELNDAIDQQLFRKLAAFAWPVVATLPGDVIGAGFLAAALCDFVVCADGARYGFTDAGVYPTPVETNVFAERFGETRAHDLLFGTEPLTGQQLRARGWSVPVLPWDEVEVHARQLAATLATKSQTALRLLKAHLTRRVAALAGELTRAAVIADAATAEQVFVARNVHELARDLSGYKAVVLLPEGLHAAEAQSLILDAPVPVVAALTGDARGNAWLAAQFCDAVVYCSEGVYSAADVAHEAATVFARRLGTSAAREVVLTGADYSGAELQQRFRALNVVEQDEVRSAAIAIAAGWVKLPRPALAAWKQRNAATLNVILSTSQESDDVQPLTTPAIALRSKVVTATVQPDGIVVVKMEDRAAKNMFSEALVDGIKEAFARIEALPGCKAVVLTGFDSYFVSGGTKETLLAIQQGTVKFTDDKIFQAALDCPLPVIAAMQGHGIGAGWCLGLFADLIVLSEESTYVSPYMNYGFTPGAGATYILPRTIGRDLAAESLLTGETTTGRALHERGAAVRIVPRAEVLPAAMTLAQQVARMSRGRLTALKQQWAGEVRNALEETYRAELAMHEATFVGRSDTLARIEQTFAAEAAPQAAVAQAPVAAGDLLPSVTATLRTLLANELLMSESDIDENAQFADLGLDSIGGVSWIRKINEKYRTTIEAVKVYSYPTLAQLSRFVKQEAEQNGTLTAPGTPVPVVVAATPVRMPEPRRTTVVPPSDKLTSWRGRTAPRFSAGRERTAEPIAVIGMAGQFPQARNVEEFWRNIAEGRNCISEIPRQRWDVGTYYQPGQPVAGKTYSQWLGALAEYDLFDPLFFNISPAEAELMDPQQRLFLQAAWHSIENAGYAAQSLSGTKCGVFVGCAAGDYHQQSRESGLTAQGFTGSATSILAARISYHLNLQGPCISIDTACSSSLVAIAEACDSLLSGDSEVALAGGVCVLSGPDMHIKTSQAGMLSSEGKCFTFDQRADGFVPGEAVGVVVLKRLSDAQRDGDVIHGVIEGWGVNQDGKTNGITAPNPESQTRLEQSVYDKHGIDPANIQLIEAHGTGTKLGDPIEVDGLKQAFRKYTQNQQYCAIGSVKSNIGHTLTAAGIAGVIKLLLALQHRQLPPTINFETLNEHIDLGNSPFYVNDRLQEWTVAESVRRQAAISSFGFSGTNAHVVVGEYVAPVPVRVSASPAIVPLSARTPAQLEQKVADLLAFVRGQQNPDLAEIAWTLQAGREAMEERLGFVVSSIEQLIENLQAFVNGDRNIAGFHHGQVRSGKESLGVVSQDEDVRETLVEKWIAQKKLAKLLDLWVKGISLDWSRLYGEVKPRRIALPIYPFAKERYWLTADAAQATETAAAVLHPLLHTNTSDFGQQSYRSTFSGSEFFLTDHQVRTGGTIVEKVLPGMAYLEMARAAIELALRERPAGTVLELHDTVWAQPVIVGGTTSVEIALLADDAERVEYEIFSGETVHCTGRALLSSNAAPEKLELDRLAREMTRGAVEPQSVYAACDRMGLFYGPSFRAIANVQRGSDQVLAHLRLPKVAEERAAEYVLHPSLLDSALQAAVGLAGDLSELSSKPRLPFALDTLRVIAPCSAEMYAWIRYASGSSATDNVVKLNIDLCDAGGNVCVQMRGMALRVLTREAGRLLATPVWQASEPIVSRRAYAERHVLDYVSAPASGYSDCAVACFEKVQSILQRKPAADVLVQVVVGREEFAGLSALLETAALENPSFAGQLIQVSPGISAEELRRRLEHEDSEPIVRYQDGVRQVVRWEEIPAEATNVAWKEDGVYLITGGRGGLGQLFATDILAKTRTARVILTGRGSDTRSASDARVSYRQVELTDRAQVRQLVEEVRPTGILHCAGMIADSFVIKKSAAELRQVLAPKVTGTLNLDEATRDLPLDFFVLFSSVAGAMGNVGQADYAAANGFLDRFAAVRNRRVAAGERQGRTRSINWPLWQAGGMAVDATSREALQRATGMQPMQTATGLEAFHRILALPHDQVLVGEGDLTQMRRALAAAPVVPVHAAQPPVETDGLVVETDGLADKTRDYLRKQFAGIIKLPAQSIDPQAALEKYGIDSILAMKLTAALETTFGPLSKTLFFEYQTIHELAAYLVKSHGARLATLFATATPAEMPVTVEAKPVTSRRLNRLRPVAGTPAEPEPIAIIGLSGRYPEAVNVEAYWQNLRDGKDCITEVPKERWNWREYFSEDRTAGGHHYSKWGGFISGVDEFDALFFNISPKEAKFIDPQERLFLQHAWMAIEDAGYTRAGLQTAAADDLPGQVGVYAGVMYTEYQLFGAEANARGQRIGVAGSAASVANRVSYALNLHGPSLTLDTMCSSSLTAIHLACQDLRQGRTSMAIAGGVNVSIHPNKYLMLSAGQFISGDGHCQSFGEGGDGYIPGEGVGVVVLKRLSDAKRDGDHVYGVIRGTALNHGGKTNGYTVPNPQAQASVISRALAESRTDARHVSYIEAHGTGTKLGDPIEITALSKAFGKHTDASGFCLIGSAKSNIGHCESAAAVAGLTKVLLQMQHQQVVPSLHSAQLNPHIDFPRTPFVVNQELRPWEQPVVDGRTLPRIAGISSFGAGGSNAHMIVEEYAAPVRQPVTSADVVVVLSARTAAQLDEKVRDLVAFLRPCLGTLDLPSLAWTLQVGREAMDERAAFVVGSNEELIAKLEAFLGGETAPYRGQVKRGSESVYSADADLQQTVDKWLAAGKLAKLADLWINGVDLDWSKLYAGSTPSRISLPTYPFARERYWIEVAPSTAAQSTVATAALHPLLHRNTSDLREQRYSSAFTGKSVSAAQYLEMARAAIEHSSPERRDTLELRDVIWVDETIVGEVHIALSGTDDAIDFEIYNGEVVLCQGRAVTAKGDAPRRVDGTPVQLPVVSEDARYVLHPELLDAALRAAAGSGEPFALDSLRIVAAATSGMTARVHGADVDLCDAQGEVRVAVRGVRSEQAVVAPVAAPVVAEKAVAVERKKPAAISLHAPAAMSSDRPRPRPSITLSNPAASAPSPVPADDRVTIEITSNAQLREAIGKLRRDEAVKVVTLRGFERLDGYDEQLAQGLASLPCASIAVLQRETIGAGFLFAAPCDFLVGSDDVRYGVGALDRDVYPLLASRFGHAGAQHLLLGSSGNGSIPAAQVETHAKALASSLAAKSRDALRLLKANLTRRTVTTAAPMVANAAEPQVFTFRQGMAVDRQVAQIARVVEEGKPVVLASEYPDFLPHDVSEELVRELHRRIVASPVPVIAALDRDARGNGWLAAQLCDATVYSDESVVSAAHVSPIAATVFARRFGTDAASEILLTGDDYTVAGLQRRVGTLLTAKADGVLETALRVARMPWAASVRDSIRDLPATIGQAADDVPPVVTAIALQSSVVTATVHPGGIVVVKMEDRDAKNMFSGAFSDGLREVFAHIDRTPGYKVVVLTGYDQYFASGGTKESLLAIQAGKVKFTDSTIFQLPLDCKLPVVAAMQGHGIGAGWSLGMFADLVLLSDESRYVSPYMEYGFTPGAGATLILPEKLGHDLARESLLTAQPLTGSALKARGLRLPVLPRAEVEARALAVAQRIAAMPRHRLVTLKQHLTARIRQSLDETYANELAMHEQTFVGRADTLAQIEKNFHQEAAPAPAAVKVTAPVSTAAGADVTATLKALLAEELQMREGDIDDNAPFVDLGLDSISGVSWVRRINTKFGTSIDATNVYSYPTVAQLSRLVREQMPAPVAPAVVEPVVVKPAAVAPVVVRSQKKLASRRGRISSRAAAAPESRKPQPIAIIGMAGQFPQADNVDEFWQNLAQGKNCISAVSRERWDAAVHYQPGEVVPGKTNSQWLGALAGFDRFDPLFFSISPTEAELMDPQQRLFLEACWHGIENAGYDARLLSGSKCGVFVGCATSDYHQISRAHQLTAQGFTGTATSVLAARISYFLNLQGPCVSIDTACSSSLVAIAQACDSLNSHDSELALAGGVYVMAGPEMHIRTAQAGMLSPEGQCYTFDQRADGFVVGEGVGVVVLKRLADAQRDGDAIYGVLEGWGVNQDGKTNGITAPNPESQTRLEQEVYDKYGIDPAGIQLIEAHGTGTKLGDPIEVEGLKKAFRKYTQKTEYCAVGSVKSNIGHTLTAAGVAGVIKLLLALKHRQLPPTVNFEKLNEHIDLAGSPFYVNTKLQDWELRGAPRRLAAISSFGFSGTNAHLVIGEAPAPAATVRPADTQVIVPLSARTPGQLRQKAVDLLAFLENDGAGVSLLDVAWTLQVGRSPMDERLGLVVDSLAELRQKLQAFVDGQTVAGLQQGQVRRSKEALALFTGDPDLLETIGKWMTNRRLGKLLELWVKGFDLDWNQLQGEPKPRRIALPAYPFARERYWIDVAPAASQTLAAAASVLHPLLHSNTSDLNEHRYSSTFDQQLSPMAALEMVRAAIERAVPGNSGAIALHDLAWGQPIVADGLGPARVHVTLTPDGEAIDFEIYTDAAVHCQGRAAFTIEPLARLDGETRRLPELPVQPELILDPALLDAALAFADAGARVPFALDTLRIAAPCTAGMVAIVRHHTTGNDVKVDLDLCDERGTVCVQLRGLALRALSATGATAAAGTVKLLAAPFWQASGFDDAGELAYDEHHVILCELSSVAAGALEALVPSSYCLALEGGSRDTAARRYTDYALRSFERIQAILQSKPAGRVLVQIVAANHQEQALFAGLSGLLRTAAMENPRFTGQLILTEVGTTADRLAARLVEEKRRGRDTLVRYERGSRQVLRWKEAGQTAAPVSFRDRGVYLITGGTGALGLLFANEILARTAETRVVLTGRADWTPEIETRLDAMSSQPGRLIYRQVDLADRDDVERLITGIRDEYRQLNGIVHAAGMTADNAIVKKSGAELLQVFEPKVTGTYNLDCATRAVELDFFVVFSSIAAVLGNVGQADYAAANGFEDAFAILRNQKVAAKKRHGLTRSINWSLWQSGGMAVDPASWELVQQSTGMQPLDTTTGIEAFYRSLAVPHDRLLVVEGVEPKMTEYLQKARIFEPVAAQPRVASSAPAAAAKVNLGQLQQQLEAMLSKVVRIDAAAMDVDQPFVELGLDSFLGAELIAAVNKAFGTELSHLRLFDYSTIREFAQYLEGQIRVATPPPVSAPAVPVAHSYPVLERRRRRAAAKRAQSDDRIAIVGMSGRYPKANDLHQYWENLVEGRSGVTEVPSSRWDVSRFFDTDRTLRDKSYSKWLGAVDDVDRFDPLFFRISPQEAEYIDPQHRLFLQESYRAFEDAGYSTTTLSNKKCGVYLGISTSDYLSLMARNGLPSAPVTSNSYAIAAARIAYYLNLKGPAISVDTACSSSLVAIHLASQALLGGEIDMALAGGVSLWLSPESYVAMSQAGMFSPSGQCKTFDDSADGIVNGEGIGAVVLKRLSDAERDGDTIYGVILGSGINQDGRTNGITAPSVNSQIELERSVYARYGIDPETITYVETHGTGTKLGDPIELEALATVFQEKTSKKNFCALGSVKSNIGHTTAAAGVAGLQKVLLSMRHRTLVPTLNVEKENARFDFARSPFYVSRETKPWSVENGTPRRAAVSSFGFSGTNAHLVVEEYRGSDAPLSANEPVIVPLSARTPEALLQRSRDLLAFLRTAQQPVDLSAVAYTLQTGREPMEERLGFVAGSTEELAEKLSAFIAGQRPVEGVLTGRVEPGSEGSTLVGGDHEMSQAVDQWVARRNLVPLLDLWVRGVDFDWNRLHAGAKPRRVSLPAYPFAKERCWIEERRVEPRLPIKATTAPVAACDLPLVACDSPVVQADRRSIESIFNQLADDTIDSGDAVEALKALV